MTRPLVYEVNTACWLNDLSVERGSRIDLNTVPDEILAQWKTLGFTHVWLMGVWSSGPKSRAIYLAHPDTAPRLDHILPGWSAADVRGSPYAIAEYRVSTALGGEKGLAAFRTQLARHGMKLVLDFVPNHLGLDHPWLAEHPEWFVQSNVGAAETFRQETRFGPRWLAHGKDPYFPAWIDTAQIDHRLAPARDALIAQLRTVAERCDGVRCDMAMLLLNDVFARNWQKFPSSGPPATGEFWAEAIAAVRRPGFVFIAEAYWDLEARLQALGFDFTYDKRVTDFVMERRVPELNEHLSGKGDSFRQASVHFLENHDEPRVAGRLSLAEHRAAAWLLFALPGMPLLHDGQLTGARVRVPVHVTRRPQEPRDPGIAAIYQELLTTFAPSWAARGRGELLLARELIVAAWHGSENETDLVAVNLMGQPARARVTLPNKSPAEIWLELPAYGTQLVQLRRR